jgi:hypothetical protein
MYYSAQTAQKMEEVDKGIASCVTEYTMEMAASQGYKRCCLVSLFCCSQNFGSDGFKVG